MNIENYYYAEIFIENLPIESTFTRHELIDYIESKTGNEISKNTTIRIIKALRSVRGYAIERAGNYGYKIGG